MREEYLTTDMARLRLRVSSRRPINIECGQDNGTSHACAELPFDEYIPDEGATLSNSEWVTVSTARYRGGRVSMRPARSGRGSRFMVRGHKMSRIVIPGLRQALEFHCGPEGGCEISFCSWGIREALGQRKPDRSNRPDRQRS